MGVYDDDIDEIIVHVHSSVFESDEAIVAVLAHDMHEINGLRKIFEERGGYVRAGDLHRLINPGIKGNLHDQAWDVADGLVRRMRQQRGSIDADR